MERKQDSTELRTSGKGQKYAEEASKVHEKYYGMVFESAGDAIFILEAEGEEAGHIMAANEAAADMYGYTVTELLTLNSKTLDTPDTAAGAPLRMRRMLNGEWIRADIIRRRKDGTVFPVEMSAGLRELGSHKYILAFDRDITERKMTEEALREREERYRSLVESTDDSIYLLDTNGSYLFMNKKHQSRLGLPEDGFLGRAYEDFHSLRETKEFVEELDKVCKTGESLQHEHSSHKDGRHFLRTLSPVKKSDGVTTY